MDVLAVGASLSILVTVLLVALAFYSSAALGGQVRLRLEGILAGSASSVESTTVTPLREETAVIGLLRFVFSGAWLERMAEDLRRANSNLEPVEFMALRIALAGLGFAATFLFVGGWMGLFLGLAISGLAFQIPQVWMNQRRVSRAKKLEAQLPEALTLISNSLKAGFGLLQSLNLAAEQLENPIASYIGQTIHEMNVGSSVEEAFLSLSERAGNYDLDLVVTAILVQRSVGGNLGEILDTVAATMRDRERIRGEISALTAQQMLTGIVIGLLPVAVGAMFLVVSPDSIGVLFTESFGKMLLGAAVVLEAVGIMIIRRILAIEV